MFRSLSLSPPLGLVVRLLFVRPPRVSRVFSVFLASWFLGRPRLCLRLLPVRLLPFLSLPLVGFSRVPLPMVPLPLHGPTGCQGPLGV